MLSPPQLVLTDAQQDDLELLLSGALAPLAGFGEPDTGVTLTAPPVTLQAAAGPGTIRLLDAEGAPLADLELTGSYPAGDQAGLVGPVHRAADREPRPFESLYRSPAQVRAMPGGHLVVPVEAPLTTADLDTIAARAAGRRVLLLALVGAGRPRGLTAPGLIRATRAAAGLLPRAEVVAVPLARHADQEQDAAVRDRVVTAYVPAGTDADVLSPDQAPDRDADLPAPVAAALRRDRPTGTEQGLVVLFTGLSGSGKSTIARGLRNALIEDGTRAVTTLDGDVVRRHLSAGLGFSRADRDTNIRRIGWVAAEIARHGGTAIASPIAPFAATRAAVREMVDAAGGAFVLVHVSTPLAECERRDRKGLYARARAGEIPDFTGISSPYEEPAHPDLRIDTTDCTIAEAVDAVLAELRRRTLLA